MDEERRTPKEVGTFEYNGGHTVRSSTSLNCEGLCLRELVLVPLRIFIRSKDRGTCPIKTPHTKEYSCLQMVPKSHP